MYSNKTLTPPAGRCWFVADTHFGHAGSISHTSRPFRDVADMDACLIEAWNAVVAPGDTVFHLGDFAHGSSAQRCAEIFGALRGKKRLIVGNHDRSRVTDLPWESVNERLTVVVEERRLVLDHYPLRAWNRSFHGTIHLHGHTHGSLSGTRQSCDVGVDVWGTGPWGLETSWPGWRRPRNSRRRPSVRPRPTRPTNEKRPRTSPGPVS